MNADALRSLGFVDAQDGWLAYGAGLFWVSVLPTASGNFRWTLNEGRNSRQRFYLPGKRLDTLKAVRQVMRLVDVLNGKEKP